MRRREPVGHDMNSNLRTGIVAISLFIILLSPILHIRAPGVSAQYPDNVSLSVGKATYALGETVCITLTVPPEEIVFFNIISPAGIFYAALPSTDREYKFKPDTAGSYVINVLLRAGGDEKFLTAGFGVTDPEIVFGEPEQGVIVVGEPVNWSQHISITNHGRFSISNFSVSIPLPAGHSNLSSDAGFSITNSSIPVDLAAGEGTSFNISYQTPPVRLVVTEEKIGISDLIPPDAFDIGVYKEIGTDEGGPGLTDEITVKQVKVWHNSSVHYHDIPVTIEADECEELVELVNGTGMVAEITVEISNETVSWTIPELSNRMYAVVEVTREQGDAEIDKPVEWQLNASGTIVRYKTPAPFKRECEPVFASGKWKKEIIIWSDTSVHYTNVTAFTSIDEMHGSDLKLFLIEDESRIDVTKNPIYEVLFIDADEDGLTDKVQWNVPFLSDKTFEVEQSITVINVQSYPQVGGIWTVYFSTAGNGTLKIENLSPDEICFAGLYRKAGSDWVVVDSAMQENITEAGWNYSEGKVEYRVLCGGKHTLKFTFGNVAYAYNQAGGPTFELISQYPATIYENSTGSFNVTWLVTTDANGLNNSSVSLVWTLWDSVLEDYHWTFRPPSNNKSAVCAHSGEQILRADNRNVSILNFEDNDTITEGNVWKWAGADENTSRLTIQKINSTHSYVHWNGTIEDTVFENMYYLNSKRLQQETSKYYDIYKAGPTRYYVALIKFWDIEASHNATDYKIHISFEATHLGIPKYLMIYYLNDSYVINGGTKPLNSPYYTYLTSYTGTTVDDYTYEPYNSSFVTFTIGVNNSKIAGSDVNATPHGYLYFRAATSFSKNYHLAYVNGVSGMNISFAQTNVAWTSTDDGASFSQAAWTPKLFFDYSKSGMQHQMKLYAANASGYWNNSTLLTNNIGLVHYPPTVPNINHFHYQGTDDYNMNGTYSGTFNVGLYLATDPDGGDVVQNLTLHYPDRTIVPDGIINNTINQTNSVHDEPHAEVSFNSSKYGAGNYTMRCVATDDEGKTSETWLGTNFTLNTIDLRVVSVTFDHWDTAENKSSVSETGAGYHVKESRNITINATIANYGVVNVTSNFNISFFDSAGVYGNWNTWFGNYTYNVTVQGQLGNTTTGYPYNTTYATRYWDPSLVGTHNISVWADPDNSTGEVAAKRTNNNASAVINVSAWQKYYGTVSGSIALADSAASSLYDWTWSNETDVGYAYIVKDGASINWSALHALGCDSNDNLNASGLDFLDADTNLAMIVGSNNATGFADNNITELFSGGDPSNATNRTYFIVHGTNITDVPIVNSTDMANLMSVEGANFITGILWDDTKDTNGYYDTADSEDLVFVTKIRVAAAGLGSAAHNYEFAAPCTLNPAVGGDLDIYMELK
jgi:hypothetical protein